MKKIFLFMGISLLCLTVSAKRVGVYCFFADNGSQLYEDENVKVVIAMEGGAGQLALYNKTDNIIYVDKANTFAYTNGQPETLFKNSATTTNHTTGQGASLNLGGVAGALGIGGVVGGILGGTTIGGGSSVQNGTTVFEQRVIAIAPKSISVLYSWNLLKDYFDKFKVEVGEAGEYGFTIDRQGRFVNPDTGSKEKFSKGLSRHYESGMSPLELRGVIKYSTEENFNSSHLVNVSNYITDIVIDNFRGVENANYNLPYCRQFFGRSVYSFRAGGAWTQCGLGIIGFIVGPLGLMGLYMGLSGMQ